MGYGFSAADIAYLASPPGVAALAEVAELELTSASQLRDVAAVRRTHGDRASALIETVRLRRRAAVKLSGAQHWLFTDDALQQATPTRVARHRARRLAGRDVHDVTCSIGAELAELVRVCPRVVGSDLDPIRLAIAQHNVRDAGAVAENAAEVGESGLQGPMGTILLAQADALVPCTSGTAIIADPARRAGGRRTHDPSALQPPLPDLLDAYAGRDLAVKCAPGLDFDLLAWAGEVEVVSLDGAVREACLWSPGLGEPGVTRRATVLTGADGVTTLTDADPDDIPERAPGEWIIDPDGAVVRAGLVRHYAARHGLWQLDSRIAYLTGDRVPDGMRGFRIIDRLDVREKTLRTELRRRDCGALEILVRGVDVDPDALRRRLKPSGSEPYTLVITRIGRTAAAFLCRASRA
ncbi:class I SAM-dependent methyltransferase [Nocardia sp. NPDC051750]|uniref:THUMP-like domain-containing protein n=1 Tax=Nocardia sp. NPDC051750 TaxID=3364325 RepID=UPI0037A2AFF2